MNRVILLLYIVGVVVALPSELRIGGLFEAENRNQEIAFNITTDIINKDSEFLKGGQLIPVVGNVGENSFKVSRTVCELMSLGILGVFGPQSTDTTDHVQSICDTMEIPHLEYRWDARQRRGSCLINLYPYPPVLAKVYADIVKEWRWKTFTAIYADNDGLLRLKELLKLFTSKHFKITVRQLDENNDHRSMFLKMRDSGERNVVMDCPASQLPEVLLQAQQVGVMGREFSYILTTLDIHTVDLEPFKYGGTNITGVRLVDPENEIVQHFVNSWFWFARRNPHMNIPPLSPDKVTVELALIHDAVLLFAKSLYNLDNSTQIQVKKLSCDTNSNWEHGYSVINYMKMSELNGMSGLVKFDHAGFRSNFVLDIVELSFDGGLVKKGSWNSTEGLKLTQVSESSSPAVEVENLHNKTFIVMIALTPPYGMLKEDRQSLTGNNRFEGFGIDIIQELAAINNFNYTFRIQEDKSSGNPDNVTKKWDGMIGEVIAGRADLAIADVTITREREEYVDFTNPFMSLGISILYKKAMKLPPSPFSFLSPFSEEVWWYMIASFLGVSMFFFVMGRISPHEWTNPYPCIEEPENLENQFTLNNSVWFTLGSIMQQGSEIAPIAVSTRMAAGIWWFFTLIMVSSYTANLAAFLTVETPFQAFRNVEDLANQNPHVIKYGAKIAGTTAHFFRDSNHPTYRKIWQYMQDNPDVMPASNEEGVNRVLKDKYAFFMESSSIEYEVERKCDLTQVGSLLDNKGYGIAMKKNSPYRHSLITSLLTLQENGKLTQLKKKWWKEKRGGGACEDDNKEGAADELGMDNVGGVFVVLVIGSSLACLISLFEVVWEIWKKKDKVSFKHELMEEIKFLLGCKGSFKPVRKGKSEAGDASETNSGSLHPFDEFVSDRKGPLE